MNAVTVDRLSHRFGRTRALDDVCLEIPRGCVFGLLGLNGAGKTTLLHHLLGLNRPQSGSVRVLDGDPITDRESVMRRVGYLSEEDTLPVWMNVADVLRFGEAVYPSWDSAYARELCEWFELSPAARLSTLSKGGRARVGLVSAIAHRPELLILDEPSSGLDPIAKADILEAVIRTVSLEGRTVIFSSHLLEEANRVCDRVAVLHHGSVKCASELSSLSSDYREWVLRPTSSGVSTEASPVVGALDWRGNEGEWSTVVAAGEPESALGNEWDLIADRSITLDRLFLAWVGQRKIGDAVSNSRQGIEREMPV